MKTYSLLALNKHLYALNKYSISTQYLLNTHSTQSDLPMIRGSNSSQYSVCHLSFTVIERLADNMRLQIIDIRTAWSVTHARTGRDHKKSLVAFLEMVCSF